MSVYKVMAEQIDPTGKVLLRKSVLAESVTCFQGNVQGVGSVTCKTGNDTVVIPIGGKDDDFQHAKVFDGAGQMTESIGYSRTSNMVTVVMGAVGNRP
jgi:hypothetical protein